jgi:hypothetical protein
VSLLLTGASSDHAFVEPNKNKTEKEITALCFMLNTQELTYTFRNAILKFH